MYVHRTHRYIIKVMLILSCHKNLISKHLLLISCLYQVSVYNMNKKLHTGVNICIFVYSVLKSKINQNRKQRNHCKLNLRKKMIFAIIECAKFHLCCFFSHIICIRFCLFFVLFCALASNFVNLTIRFVYLY